MAEPPPPAAALPRSTPPLPQPPPLQMVLADDAPPGPAATPSTLAADGRMAEPPPALPLLNLPRPATLPPLPAAPPTMPSSASSTTSAGTLAALPPPSDHVAHNPRVGDSGLDEDCDSTSLSAICARMIQSSTYTIEVKVYGNGGNWTFYWEIVDGTSTNMEDLLSCIAGTLSFPLCSEDKIFLEYCN